MNPLQIRLIRPMRWQVGRTSTIAETDDSAQSIWAESSNLAHVYKILSIPNLHFLSRRCSMLPQSPDCVKMIQLEMLQKR